MRQCFDPLPWKIFHSGREELLTYLPAPALIIEPWGIPAAGRSKWIAKGGQDISIAVRMGGIYVYSGD